MPTTNSGFLYADQPALLVPSALPPWLASSSSTSAVRPSSPSVTLTLSPLAGPPTPSIPWLQDNNNNSHGGNVMSNMNISSLGISPMIGENPMLNEFAECCRELEEGHRAWAAHKKEAAWRLKRVELQLESEKASRKREKVDEIEGKVKALREEQRATLDRIEAEYREQLAGLRIEAEVKEQKLAEQWAAKHSRLTKFIEQMGCRSIVNEPNGR